MNVFFENPQLRLTSLTKEHQEDILWFKFQLRVVINEITTNICGFLNYRTESENFFNFKQQAIFLCQSLLMYNQRIGTLQNVSLSNSKRSSLISLKFESFASNHQTNSAGFSILKDTLENDPVSTYKILQLFYSFKSDSFQRLDIFTGTFLITLYSIYF